MKELKQGGINVGALVVGILFVLTSLLSLQNPLSNLFGFAMFLAIAAIIKGIFEIFMRNKLKELTGYKTYIPIIIGVISIIVGVYFLLNPAIAVEIVPFIFAIWFISDSICRLFTLSFVKKISKGYFWFSLIINVLGIILGISLLFDPISSALTFSFLISIYFMMFGIDYIVYSFRKV